MKGWWMMEWWVDGADRGSATRTTGWCRIGETSAWLPERSRELIPETRGSIVGGTAWCKWTSRGERRWIHWYNTAGVLCEFVTNLVRSVRRRLRSPWRRLQQKIHLISVQCPGQLSIASLRGRRLNRVPPSSGCKGGNIISNITSAGWQITLGGINPAPPYYPCSVNRYIGLLTAVPKRTLVARRVFPVAVFELNSMKWTSK